MKTFAVKRKQSAPAIGKARSYLHHPIGPVQQAQRAETRRILHTTGAQTKLTIGQPNDKYEQEADREADEVMHMSDGLSAAAPPTLDARPSEDSHPIPYRTEMERRFAMDFGGVNAHIGSNARVACDSLGATAITVGDDIAFRDERPPRNLVAHELAHVVQQRRGAAHGLATTPSLELNQSPHAEAEAEQASSGAATQRFAWVGHAAPYGRPQATLATIARNRRWRQRIRTRSLAVGALTRQVINTSFNTRLGQPTRPGGSPRYRFSLRVPATNAARRPLQWGLERLGNDLDTMPFSGPRGQRGTILDNNITLVAQVNMTGTNLLQTHAALTRWYPRGRAAFRFTKIPARQHGEIHIEDAAAGPQLGAQMRVTRVTGGRATALTVPGTRTRFTLAGNWTAAKLGSLQQALRMIRPRALALVNGLTFVATARVVAATSEQGRYSQSAHRIEIHHSAWTSHLPRGIGGRRRPAVGGTVLAFRSDPPVYTILHEIGHAIDLRRLELADRAYRAALNAYNRGPKNRAASQRLARARRAYTRARSRSGHRMTTRRIRVEDRGRGVSRRGLMRPRRLGAFRRAAVADGARVIRRRAPGTRAVTYEIRGGLTSYSNTSWAEFYAEAFTAFISDPTTYALLRPQTNRYFQSLVAPPARRRRRRRRSRRTRRIP